jgi:hypothetical protein
MEKSNYFDLKNKEDIIRLFRYSPISSVRETILEQKSIKSNYSARFQDLKINSEGKTNVPTLNHFQDSRLSIYPSQFQNISNFPSSSNYGPTFSTYLEKRQEMLNDFTDRVPGKHLHTFPSSGNAGLFGFTYLGDVNAWRREDLIGTEFSLMVDVHESIHTPDEYETRRITEWMMSKDNSKYIK